MLYLPKVQPTYQCAAVHTLSLGNFVQSRVVKDVLPSFQPHPSDMALIVCPRVRPSDVLVQAVDELAAWPDPYYLLEPLSVSQRMSVDVGFAANDDPEVKTADKCTNRIWIHSKLHMARNGKSDLRISALALVARKPFNAPFHFCLGIFEQTVYHVYHLFLRAGHCGLRTVHMQRLNLMS